MNTYDQSVRLTIKRLTIWDLFAILLLIGCITTFVWFARQTQLPFYLDGPHQSISLSSKLLPNYALYTTARLFIALGLSLLFTLTVGTLAAKNEMMGRLIIPLLDILQAVPVLGFLSVAVVGFIHLFPHRQLGPECAAIFAIFTGQAWNMTFSLYQSLITLPDEYKEVSRMLGLSAWKKFWRIEIPYAMPALLWNTMMSMSGSWFFVVASEAISVAGVNVHLPGIGSYIALAIQQSNVTAIWNAIFTMLAIILVYDQLIFRPLVSWSSRFHAQDADAATSSWLLEALKKSELYRYLSQWPPHWLRFPKSWGKSRNLTPSHTFLPSIALKLLWLILGCCVLLFLMTTYHWVRSLQLFEVREALWLGLLTWLRIVAILIICSVIWIPIGVFIGQRPKWLPWAQPLVQIGAAFPANLLYPVAIYAIIHYNLNPEIWTAPLLALGAQWYIVFNVIAGASAIPKDFYFVANNLHVKKLLRWRRLILPMIFPYYLTGLITAAGGAWNASILAEYLRWGHTTLQAHGLGAYITANTQAGNFSACALGIVVMCIYVLVINHFLWRPLYRFSQRRFGLPN